VLPLVLPLLPLLVLPLLVLPLLVLPLLVLAPLLPPLLPVPPTPPVPEVPPPPPPPPQATSRLAALAASKRNTFRFENICKTPFIGEPRLPRRRWLIDVVYPPTPLPNVMTLVRPD
jgi:hypothetical protein